MKSFLVPVCVILLVFSLSSCKKNDGTLRNASNNLEYASSYLDPIEIRPSFGNRINLENAIPYQDMLGIIMGNAPSATNGKADWLKDVQITHTQLMTAYISIISEKAYAANHLTGSKIVYVYPTSSVEEEVEIATFAGYNAMDSRINYTLNTTDLTALFRDHSFGSIYVLLNFDDYSPNPMKLSYNIGFTFQYTYYTKTSK